MKLDVIVPETKEAFDEKGLPFDEEEFKKGVENCNSIGEY